jgi:hypothetical protein
MHYYGYYGESRICECQELEPCGSRRIGLVTVLTRGKPELTGVQNDLHMRGGYYDLKSRKRAVEAPFLRSTCGRRYIQIGEQALGHSVESYIEPIEP